MIRLFDSHCHLQDPRIFNMANQVIEKAIANGVIHFAVNGVSEKDWHLVKQMSYKYPSVIPNFGVHPWFITDRSPNWFITLKQFLESTPEAGIGEIGIDKSVKGKQINFAEQVEVFSQQLHLAKDLNKPASIHCVRAFGDLFEILKSIGPFPAGIILHSYLGSAEMVPEFAKLGAYFSFSGFLMSMKESKARKMLKVVPSERILLETDSPDALPKIVDSGSLYLIETEGSASKEVENTTSSEDTPNHPANIHHVLTYVASLLEMTKEELADISFNNASRVFSYQGSKVKLDGNTG